MNFWTVEDGELVCYKRTGECNRCGQCCCTHTIVYQMEVVFDSECNGDDEENSCEWSEREGWNMFLAQGIWWYFKITEIKDTSGRCPSLTEDNMCSEWQNMNTFRPICRYWPFHPSHVQKFPGCSFKFEREQVE